MFHKKQIMKTMCPMCGVSEKEANGYCKPCKNLKAKWYRQTIIKTPEQRRKANSRSQAKVYQRRGKLIQQPCRDCGSLKSEKHHPDYSQPLLVVWLCRPCHLKLHRMT